MTRAYEPCPFVVESWPDWKRCEKPVTIRPGQPGYCEAHAARLPMWPKEVDDVR